MKKRKQGVSLIVLIITIVVVIILAAAVILTLANNNPVEDAKKATLLNDVSELKNQLTLYIGKQYLNTQGSFDITSLNGKKLEEVITEIPEKYAGKFEIENGEIVGTDELTEQEKEWLEGILGNGNGGETGGIPTPEGGSVYTDSAGIKVPVPSGYTVSTISGENTVANGLVIKSGSNGAATTGINEFVWVPVSDVNELYDSASNKGKLYDFSTGRVSSIRSDCLTTTNGYREPDVVSNFDGGPEDTAGITKEGLQSEFNAMITSVKKYGGFYIGRYETGNLSQTTPVVQKYNTDICNQEWYNMYTRTRNIISNASGQTTIIWGCQWDATLRWMNKDATTGNYATDGTGKGNYYDQTFTYHTGSGTATKSLNTSTRIPAGGYEGAKVKNIYDMAGNVWDWTMEVISTEYRVFRGAAYSFDATVYPASYRGNTVPVGMSGYIGVRVQLYLK